MVYRDSRRTRGHRSKADPVRSRAERGRGTDIAQLNGRLAPRVTLFGDDLSGTTEALAAALGSGHGPARVHLHADDGRARFAQPADPGPPSGWHAQDLNVRHVPHHSAGEKYALALRRTLETNRSQVVVLKIDSLLRGNVAAAVAAVEPGPDRPVVLAPALPAQGRRVIGGVLRVPRDGRSAPGALEGGQTDVSVAAGRPISVIGLDAVRAGQDELARRLGELAAVGVVAACDAESEADLDLVAAAAMQHRTAVVIGSAGAAAAVGRVLRASAEPVPEPPQRVMPACADLRGHRPVLVVVGSAEPRAQRQVAVLQQRGAQVVTLDATRRGAVGPLAAQLRRQVQDGCAVLRVAAEPSDPQRSDTILQQLAETAALAVGQQPEAGLVLTGGATARAVLDRMQCRSMLLRCEVHPGAAHLTTEEGRHVVTRPGSHGQPDSLSRLAEHLGAQLITEPGTARRSHVTEGQQ